MDEKTRTRVGGPEDPREGLEAVVALRRMLEALEAAQVENAVVAGWSWARIAEVLGVSKQAVHKKHARRIRAKYPGKVPAREGEGRVIFNRFTRETRACVEAAVKEARMLGHDSVGDEDLLMGILHTDEGIGAAALSSLGVTLEGAREESEQMLSDALASIGISLEQVRREAGDAFAMRVPDNRRIPFSPRAKKALEQALREAVRLRNNRIGTEHVLLGILRNKDGTAVRMLAGMGVSPEALEDWLCEFRGRAAG